MKIKAGDKKVRDAATQVISKVKIGDGAPVRFGK